MNQDTGAIRALAENEEPLKNEVLLTQMESLLLERVPPRARMDALKDMRDPKNAEDVAFLQEHVGEVDFVFERLVRREGLYGQAFFGHKATKKQRKQIRRCWKQAQAVVKRYVGDIERDARAKAGVRLEDPSIGLAKVARETGTEPTTDQVPGEPARDGLAD